MKKANRKAVVPIHTRRFLGAYSNARDGERVPETVLFFAGVFLTVGLPEIICTAYGGIIPFIAFAATASAGSLLGWAIYRQTPYTFASCAGTRDAPPADSGQDGARKKAA